MSDFNPKQGEMILVGEVEGRWMSVPRVFVCLHQGGWLCQYDHDEDRFKVWLYAKPLPVEPEPILFTRETWPKQVVWLRTETNKAEGSEQVVCVHQDGVSTLNCFISYSTLGIENQMSLDFGKTWQPCHYTPTE